jgi:hypothetical protein
MLVSHEELNKQIDIIERLNQSAFNVFKGSPDIQLCDSTYGNTDSQRFRKMTTSEMQRFRSNTSPLHVWITPVLKWRDIQYALDKRENLGKKELHSISIMALNQYDYAFLDAVHETAKTQPELLVSSYFLSRHIARLIIESELQLHELYEMISVVGIMSYRLNILNVEQCLKKRDRVERFMHLSDQALQNFMHRREYGL